MSILFVDGLGIEAYSGTKILELSCADVRSHDDDGVLEVDTAAEAVGEASFVHHLKQEIEDIGMSLLDFVEKHDGVGATSNLLGELTAFLVSDVSRRCSDETRHCEFFHIFAHVDADKCVGRIEHIFGEFLGKVGFADACRTEEEESADRLVGILQADTVALDGLNHFFDSVVLTDDSFLDGRAHLQKTFSFSHGYALNGYAGHHCHDLGHLVLVDGDALVFELFFPIGLSFVETIAQFVGLVSPGSRAFEILRAGSFDFLLIGLFDFRLKFLDFLGDNNIGDVHAAAGLVESVDSLIGEVAVGNIAFGQLHAGFESTIGVIHIVVSLILRFYVVEDFQGFLSRSGFYHNFLEATFESAVLFDVLAVFIKSCGADTLYLAPCESRLQHIGSIHRALGVTGAHDCMDFIYEKDDIAVARQFGEDSLDAFLEFTAIFRSGDY